MTVLSDTTIRELCTGSKPMIHPFNGEQVRYLNNEKVISYGLSSYGYDVMLSPHCELFDNKHGRIIDPKNFERQECLTRMRMQFDSEGDYVILPPHSYMLGHTSETFDIPNNVMVICVGKSTYARSGIHINVTPIEPGFRGQIVIEIANATNSPAKIYIYEGIAQFIFLRGDKPCSTSYADRRGKYQDQTGIAHAKV